MGLDYVIEEWKLVVISPEKKEYSLEEINTWVDNAKKGINQLEDTRQWLYSELYFRVVLQKKAKELWLE